MSVTLQEATTRLKSIIKKQRVDFFKPIIIAEILHRSRTTGSIQILELESYRLSSRKWGNEASKKLSGKVGKSTDDTYQGIWKEKYMPPHYLAALDEDNKATGGAVERYIYLSYAWTQDVVTGMIAAIEAASPATFDLRALLTLFVTNPGIKRSIDKAYEIVAYCLFETVVTTLGAQVRVSVPVANSDLLDEFSDLAQKLLGLKKGHSEWEQDAHIYRVGVTNAADRGLDMWANFGPAIQVKHLTLNPQRAKRIIDQVESDAIVIVCIDKDARLIEALTQQIGWGRRVRGIVTESELIVWYEKCLRGKYAERLAVPLLAELLKNFKAEFPPNNKITGFLEERGYPAMQYQERWRTIADESTEKPNALPITL